MLNLKVFAAIDLFEGKVVRLAKGNPNKKVVYSNDPIGIAEKWEREGIQSLHIVDLDATLTSGNNLEVANKIIEKVNIPVQFAGGIRSFELAQKLLKVVDKIVIGTLAYKDPRIVEKLTIEFGSDRIVLAIDQKDNMVMINGWRNSACINIFDAIKKYNEIGVNYFLLTSIERDGMLLGPDFDILNKACSFKNVNIIASGGISEDEDIIKVKKMGAYAVILGKALYDGKINIKSIRAITNSNTM